MTENRTKPFTAHERYQFEAWLDFVEKGLAVTYALSQEGDAYDGGRSGVTTRVTGVRLYATDVALLQSRIFRAAGRVKRERAACFDQALSDLYDATASALPKIRALRNALFALPPS